MNGIDYFEAGGDVVRWATEHGESTPAVFCFGSLVALVGSLGIKHA